MGEGRLVCLLSAALICFMAGCAPRGTPAPLITGSADTAAPEKNPPPGAVVVRPGDTLAAIARYHNTALQALVAANGLQDPNRIRPGQVLRLPGAGGGAPPAPPRPAAAPARTPVVSSPLPPVSPPRAAPQPAAPPAMQAEQDAGEDQTGALVIAEDAPPRPLPAPAPIPAKQPAAALTPASSPMEETRFLWPASGPILSEFGSKPNGLHNDGINIAMPPNGPVQAAGDGEVIYAGDGLRGYGNLLLIRHAGGWVTAYAHNSRLLVERGDKVKRGQAIAKAGRSGGVAQDQLHFEIRQGAKAVNPKPLLVGG